MRTQEYALYFQFQIAFAFIYLGILNNITFFITLRAPFGITPHFLKVRICDFKKYAAINTVISDKN